MESYVCASVCCIVLSAFGCLDGVLERAGLKRSDAAYAALCVVALSLFRFKPIIEFDIDISALALPAAFGLIAMNREGQGARTLARLSLVTTIPIAVSAAYMLYELYTTTYAFFSLRAESVCMVQLALCAFVLAVTSFRFAEKKAV